MTKIAIDPQSLRRTASTIREVGHEYLAIVRELETITQDFPNMPVEYRGNIRHAIEAIMEDLARLVLAHDPDVAAMEIAIRIIERDEGRVWRTGAGRFLSVLNASYSIVDEVYDTALKYGISLDEAADRLGTGSNITKELVRVLGVEGTVSAGTMKRLTGWAGIGLDFLEEYGRSNDSLWEATQRTLVSSGTAAVVGALLAKGCGRFVPIPLVKGACMIVGGRFGESWGDQLNEELFDHGRRTPEEARQIRAASSPSGLTPEEEAQRLEDARLGFEEARRSLVEELIAAGESREDAERIAEVNFPQYLLLVP